MLLPAARQRPLNPRIRQQLRRVASSSLALLLALSLSLPARAADCEVDPAPDWIRCPVAVLAARKAERADALDALAIERKRAADATLRAETAEARSRRLDAELQAARDAVAPCPEPEPPVVPVLLGAAGGVVLALVAVLAVVFGGR
jgi:hypothetical protein